MIGRSTYKALVAIFNRQCEVREGKVVVNAKTGGDCIQNPSDADATYDAHKGRGRCHPLSGTQGTCVAPFALGLTPCPGLPYPSAKWFNSIRYSVPGTRPELGRPLMPRPRVAAQLRASRPSRCQRAGPAPARGGKHEWRSARRRDAGPLSSG